MRGKYYKGICCVLIMTFFLLQGSFVLAETEEKMYIVEFKNDVVLFQTDQKNERFNILTESELRECIEAGMVERYEEDYAVELFEGAVESTDTYEENATLEKWDLEKINAAGAREIGCLGQEVKVAVIDSGVNSHPDLVGNIVEGYNYIKSTTDVKDNIGHGTFVSGIIAAESNLFGVEGVAPKVKIIPLKCFDTGVTTKVSMICNAIYGAVDNYQCDVINMSLGLTNHSDNLQEAIDYAVSKGVCVVAAVGNKGDEVLYYPAAYENVIGVGSVNSELNKSTFSQYNESVYIVAPGEDVLSTNSDDEYSTKSGTSFSTPQVSGMLAVLKNIKPDLTNSEAMLILKETSLDLGDEGYDNNYGYGLIDIKSATEYMLKDVNYFISPIITTDETSFVVILNNTGQTFDGVCMWGNYKGKLMKDVDGTEIHIDPQKTVKVESTFINDKIKCIIWNSISDITTIAGPQEREEIQ